MRKIGVMQLVHARHEYLNAIWNQLPHLGCPVHLGITLSRPTAEVLATVQRTLDYELSTRVTVSVHEAPFSPLAERERFMELRQWQLEQLPRDCTHGVIWDDDHLLEDPREVVCAVDDGADLTYIKKVHFWDSTDTYNAAFPVHNSVFVFRLLPGDRFPLDRTIHAPAKIHDTGRAVQLQGHLLDYGYLREYDRRRCWADYKRVGKIDAATRPLVLPPDLKKWTGIDPLSPRLKKVLNADT